MASGSQAVTGSYWGKLIGGLVGFLLGGWLGAVIGVVVGHQIDTVIARHGDESAVGADRRRVQLEFFATTFSVMGHLAKADGRVSEDEIRAARNVMQRMNLSQEQVKDAIRLFNEGKRPDFPLETVLEDFRETCGHRGDLLRAFVEIQVVAALADGNVHQDQRRLLWKICVQLGLSRVDLAQIEALARAQAADAAHRAPATAADRLSQAYRVLGVTREAGDAAVKTAYRRLMSQHHPDKLVSKGLPEEMLQVAREKVREIRAAYDLVKEARGMR